MNKTLILFAVILRISTVSFANTFTVTSTSDSGNGTLRWAIQNCNVYPGSHTIQFNIPLTDAGYISAQGVWRISLSSNLPMINHSNVLIDGNSQTSFAGNTNPYGPEIMLNGENAGWADYGFHIYNVSGVSIKGLIIGGFVVGVQVSGENANNNIVAGNYIGCNFDASSSIGNTHGIYILSGPHHNTIGGNTAADRNILSGNNHTGMRIVNANYNIIQGNFVGLNRTGTEILHNYDGISIEGTSKYNLIGGYSSSERNFVGGNMNYGIPVFGIGCYYNIIAGNYIGTDITGTLSMPNTYGVLFDDGACYNTLGGKVTGAGNLISGNSGYGVFIYNFGTMKDTITGNLIGTDASGMTALPNANGIVIDGPSYLHTIDNNVISGNLQMGIDIHIAGSDSNVVVNNKIGTDITGTAPLGNEIDGIRIAEGPCHNIIGRQGQGNIIAYNGGNGVTVMTPAETGNTISGNSIFGNAGIGIDLFPQGVTLNDAGDSDDGPNEGMNFPVISQILIAGVIQISGHIDSPNSGNNYIEFFKSDNHTSGYGQGMIYLGCCIAEQSGDFTITITEGLASGDYICSTATDANGNTSEFSQNYLCIQTGMPEIENKPNIPYIYPNPASQSIQLANISIGSEISISNIFGEIIYYGIWSGRAIPIWNLQPGYYYIACKTNKTIALPLIVTRQ